MYFLQIWGGVKTEQIIEILKHLKNKPFGARYRGLKSITPATQVEWQLEIRSQCEASLGKKLVRSHLNQ
jgi:hypothetical protein